MPFLYHLEIDTFFVSGLDTPSFIKLFCRHGWLARFETATVMLIVSVIFSLIDLHGLPKTLINFLSFFLVGKMAIESDKLHKLTALFKFSRPATMLSFLTPSVSSIFK